MLHRQNDSRPVPQEQRVQRHTERGDVVAPTQHDVGAHHPVERAWRQRFAAPVQCAHLNFRRAVQAVHVSCRIAPQQFEQLRCVRAAFAEHHALCAKSCRVYTAGAGTRAELEHRAAL
eukprot:468483-Prymnesium_polylepis.2